MGAKHITNQVASIGEQSLSRTSIAGSAVRHDSRQENELAQDERVVPYNSMKPADDLPTGTQSNLNSNDTYLSIDQQQPLHVFERRGR
jgi:hypothetical protein